MITGNQEYIREMNRHLVLNEIIKTKTISRADLSKKLKLTKATVSTIVQELMNQNLVIEIGSAQTTKGRKPILLEFYKQSGHVISMDINIDKVTIMLSDLNGTNCIIKEEHLKDFNITTASIIKILDKILATIPPTPHGVVGICIGIHGTVDHNKIIFTPYYQIEDSNLGFLLAEHFHIPVYIENEANLSAIGEYTFHYLGKNIVYINIHSGIGTGIIINGSLFKGSNGYAGELGHTILFPKGKKCPCGNEGCLEQYASEKAILETYANEKKYSFITIEKFIRDYQNKDSLAIQLVDNFVLYMSIGINNILNTLDPDVVVLNSSFTNYIPGLTIRIQEHIKNRIGKNFHLEIDEMQDISEFLGGVSLCVKGFLNPHS